MTQERRRRKDFVPTINDLQTVAERIAAKGGFRAVKTALYHESGGIDIVAGENESAKIVFTLGIGTDTVTYLNKSTFAADKKWICKLKPLSEIKSFDDLARTVDDFINLPPKESELIDISSEGTQRMLEQYQERALANVKDSAITSSWGAKKPQPYGK